MTSGNFRPFPISSVVIERSERQRRELTHIDELAESINRIGLIHPIVLTADGVLVAGERRLTACRALGWTSIPAQFVEDLSDYDLQCIEFEENVKRKDLTWQDYTATIDRFHKLKMENEVGWTQEKTADALGITKQSVSQHLDVASALTNDRVAGAEKFSVASNIVRRNNERARTSVLKTVTDIFKAPEEVASAEAPPIQLANFHEWQETYAGPKFNLIHCDFPYGINVADAPRQNSAIKDYYEDTPDTYWALVSRLSRAMENVIADSAHLIFWYSMDYYADTVVELTRMGWKVNPFPLIWHKIDNAGIAPDPQRGPRRTYETALFASRSDRLLTQAGAKSNSFGYPGSRKEGQHVSYKPTPVLRHFLSMVCDEYTSILDPTCGSGSAIRVARDLGARQCLGLEAIEEFYNRTILHWENDDVYS